LNFLDNSIQIKDRLNKELKNIESKCKNIIRGLETLNLTLGEDAEGKEKIQKDELRKKKRQIEMLMNI
jgi:hypothetical protein